MSLAGTKETIVSSGDFLLKTFSGCDYQPWTDPYFFLGLIKHDRQTRTDKKKLFLRVADFPEHHVLFSSCFDSESPNWCMIDAARLFVFAFSSSSSSSFFLCQPPARPSLCSFFSFLVSCLCLSVC
jgi:hypothetical protein